MGQLVDGVWRQDAIRTENGRFVRPTTRYRNWITPDGGAGPSGEGGFAAEGGRYHLYVSFACPWAHRTLIFRKLKKLDALISLSNVSPHMGEEGWTFNQSEGSSGDALNGAGKLYEVYRLADPRYTGRVTVPVLWDKKRKTIVNNESSEIIRMFNSAFDALTGDGTDFYPPALRARDRARQRSRLSEHQQRRLSRGLRDDASRLRGSLSRSVRRARCGGGDAGAAPLSCRRHAQRSRLAAVHDADPLRRGLCRPLQMQSAAHRRLSESVELSARALSGAGRRRDGRY